MQFSRAPHLQQPPSRRGVATVEVAITFPVLMLILLFSIEVARLNTLRNILESAAYEGARRGIVPGATVEDIEAAALAITQQSQAKDVVITTNPTVITSSTQSLTVSIDVPLASNSWVGKPTSRHMVRSCTLFRERTD